MIRRQISVSYTETAHLWALPLFWCRRRDSNSHSLRHYPLKIACLPISPRRHSGCDCTASCITLPVVFGLLDATYAKARLVAKNTAARIPVALLKKFAEPVAPKRLPEAPLPNAAPISAPLPCCINTKPIIDRATSICTVKTTEKSQFIFYTYQFAARQIAKNSSATNAAPPINPPSMSLCANNSAAF
jgi:hypothetical protein